MSVKSAEVVGFGLFVAELATVVSTKLERAVLLDIVRVDIVCRESDVVFEALVATVVAAVVVATVDIGEFNVTALSVNVEGPGIADRSADIALVVAAIVTSVEMSNLVPILMIMTKISGETM
ncbi:hypothetical protein HK100_002994 [Physocladia obscura]|uniref:Uncharacterized protein n=1 Tax=Physocladia obscura TaxID=109957 RepID=A0AAD5XDU8_9FUNG|nr:hypothetical protein HK100_002994 [Physocladia obscura]